MVPNDISSSQIEAIANFPTSRTVSHCGTKFGVSPFDIYARCPTCGTKIKVRAFSSGPDVEDLFDAFFNWLRQPGTSEVVARRQSELAED